MLLELHDRTGKTTFDLTQEEIANRLSAQRTTINEAWKALSSAGAVKSMRGKVSIHDSGALQKLSCDCYQALAASRYWPLKTESDQPASPATVNL